MTLFANFRSTQNDWVRLPINRGCVTILPKVRIVNKGTANLVTIKTEEIVWNPLHTGTQLKKKLANFTKPPFYDSRIDKIAVSKSVYPTGFPITNSLRINRNTINVFMHIGLDALGRLF